MKSREKAKYTEKITVYLTKEQLKELDNIVECSYSNRAIVIRQALQHFLEGKY